MRPGEDVPPPAEVAAWCREHLGAEPVAEVFRAGYLSAAVGVRLDDGREVVVKARPPAPRLAGCVEVQRRLHLAGFPCPDVLAGPSPLGRLAATAEALVGGGDLFPPGHRDPAPFASALAALLAAAPVPGDVPTLAPHPPWTAWDHPGPGFWPPPDDRDADLDAVDGHRWLDDAAGAARRRLRLDPGGPVVVGHGDWYTGNLRWHGDRLHVAHDWDSAIADAEPVIVGFAAAVYPATEEGTEATVDETAAFLDAYGDARGLPLTAGEREAAWAAGLWLRCFDTKKQVATTGEPRSLLRGEATERRRLAGAV